MNPPDLNDADRDSVAIQRNLQQITYSSFNKPTAITENGYTLTIDYGYDQQRRRSVLKDASNNTIYTRIFAGDYEEETAGGVTRKIHYINSPSGLVAVYITVNSTSTMYYILTDKLGSITHLLDNAGNVVQQYAYDAWGKRSLIVNNASTTGYILYRGYTGHEHIDATNASSYQFSLINMNGRFYDPTIGRMLSPDNQSQGGAQGFNKYSYCSNNPLKYTDPSGWVNIGGVGGGDRSGGVSGFATQADLMFQNKAYNGWGIDGPDNLGGGGGAFAHLSANYDANGVGTNLAAEYAQLADPNNPYQAEKLAQMNYYNAVFGGDFLKFQNASKALSNAEKTVDKLLNGGGSNNAESGGVKLYAMVGNDMAEIADGVHSISINGINFIKSWEKLRLQPYDDGTGVITIAWGHVLEDPYAYNESPGITLEMAEAILASDLQTRIDKINNLVKTPLSQNQFDALVSYVFNTNSLSKTNLLLNLNSMNFSGAASEMDINKDSHGKFMQGLENRRIAERNLFLNGIYIYTH